ncbi:hypothetical protein CGRA01v4_04374 [Colletotrichum graminicola]|nr:hypothetical protein CGRA01v4_04374 [Colletotrichum graminicola]
MRTGCNVELGRGTAENGEKRGDERERRTNALLMTGS